ncbi:hypothetical protein P153DRAFT_353544 [Dothidotthia symphoricarpi CBS 119687]|uniref:DUF7779 domain-containing protein n=1 Tax=Dothidotthia symphoricarpi CBS 119687 TaxID=1392245 RepID=A0A6A6APL0_9PLEO|nr:uncharacterized protein P153DRAFT_353544 [Dothidotthia symphoricarpi CBS 119687]KAF2133133.1 hypothetical protein P153DRAFT_353544 [Dothidotthia symphoricarpi CBS 119687]
MSFTCGDEYAAHLKGHGSQGNQFNDAQIQLLKRQRGLPDPSPVKCCPLCNISLGNLSQPYNEGTAYSSRKGTEQPSPATLALKMQKHIASHLMTIASYSLPWLDETDGDVASDRPLSLASEITSNELAEGSDKPRHSDSHRDFPDELGTPTFDDPDNEPDEYIPGEWDFITDTSYEGQEFDSLLSSFVRKYHVDMAFTGSTKREPSLPCSVYGPAGIGKTQVAVEFVYRHMQEFDAVFWVHADEASKLIEDINRITVHLGLVDEASADSGDQSLTRDLFKRWLGNPTISSKSDLRSERANWLLILDHVIEPAILDQFWPTERECGSILITSRRPMPWSHDRYPSHTLHPFTPLEGANFMCSLLNNGVSPEEKQCASIISSKVKGVPYALRHLTKWITGENLSFSEFLTQNHTRENKELQKKMRGELGRFVMAEEHSFLEVAFESIKHSRPLLDVLAMLDPDKIPERILITDSPHVFIQGYPATQSSLHEALQELLKYSLVIRSPTSATYGIHRIVQDAVRKQMSPIYSRDVYNTCVLLLSAQWPFHTFTWRHGISRWPQCEELFPHIIRLRRHSSNIHTDEYHLYGAFLYARLWCDCGWYCHERGRTRESDDFSGIAQRLCEELKSSYPLLLVNQQPHLPNERDIENILAEIHHNRGVMANEINRPTESLEYLSKFHAMMMNDLGNRRPGTDMRLALSFNELGCAYMLRNDYSRAEKCFERSISSMEQLDNYERWQVSLPGVNLGVVYWLTERYTEALEVLSQGLRDREKKFGSNDQESFITGRFLYTLGNVHESLSNYDVSLEYHQRSLNHYRNTLGSAHHRTADAFVRITRHFMRLGQLAEALDLVDKAIHIYHNFDSAFEAETARAKFCKSKVLRQVGDTAKADRELAESVRWYYELNRQDATGDGKIQEADFDRLVVFWSR